MPSLQSVVRTPGERKEFMAKFVLDNGKPRTIRFGTSSNFALNPSKTLADRDNYIARHRVRENFSNPITAGSLSRHILWGQSRNWPSNVRSFKRKFNV